MHDYRQSHADEWASELLDLERSRAVVAAQEQARHRVCAGALAALLLLALMVAAVSVETAWTETNAAQVAAE